MEAWKVIFILYALPLVFIVTMPILVVLNSRSKSPGSCTTRFIGAHPSNRVVNRYHDGKGFRGYCTRCNKHVMEDDNQNWKEA